MLTPRHLLLLSATSFGLILQPARADEKPFRQVIDQEIKAAWQRENIKPAPRSSDAEFLRRIHLDLVGTIPTHDETRQFLQDTDEQKRAKLIDRLLEDPRFARQQAGVWDLAIFGRQPPGGDVTRRRDVFQKWLQEKFAKNEPYDVWVKEVLNAEGNTSEVGPAMFYAQFRNQPEEAAMAVSRLFLGTQLQCARCHDHPFDKWQQLDFYGMAGFFARLVFVEGGNANQRTMLIGEKRTGEVMFSGPVTEQVPGKKGTPVQAKFLGSTPLEEPALPAGFKDVEVKGAKAFPKPDFSRKEKLAEWVVAPENPYFAKAVANRVWAQFMGRGVVHLVDNLSDKNPPSHPELFEALSKELKSRKYDLKWYIRELVNSETYQLSGRGESTDAATRWFERARVRPLTAEEILAALRLATGYDLSVKPGEKLPNAGNEYFMRYFGEPLNGRGDFQASLNEHLFLNNSTNLRQMIQAKKGNLADTLATSKEPAEERVERLFLTVLSRMPRAEEKERFAAHLTTAGQKPEALVEEAVWALLNSAEFRFNH